jgi:hypothetical protein
MKTPRPDPTADEERTANKCVFVSDLADYMKIGRHTITAWIHRQRISIKKQRRRDTGQIANAISPDDAKRVMREMPEAPEIVNPADLT